MNKDVIYIEPEDDITDIITKIENSKEKIVALVPPKKAAVLRSLVNIKLMAKAAGTHEKTIVLVTTDPSIVKLAASTKIPVTKNLQSAPTVPKVDESEEIETASQEEIVEASEAKDEISDTSDEPSGDNKAGAEDAAAHKLEGKSGFLDEEIEKDDSADKKKVKKDKKDKKPGLKSSNPVIRWIQEHKKLVILCGVGLVLLLIVGIWAFVIAPKAEVAVGIRTTATNFSENVSFTEKLADENAQEGRFYLEEKKIESKSEVEFKATGQKNVGERASGDVVVYAYFQDAGQIAINAGTVFNYDGKSYISQTETTLGWNGESWSVCDNKDASASEQRRSGCQMSARVAVIAESSGASYNVSASTTGWTTVANVDGVYSDKAMAGGTDKTITVVQQSDIDKAKEKLETVNESANKQKLLATIPEDAFVIESSFKQTIGEATSTPALGEEVEEGEKATLSVTTTDSIYIIDNTKVEEFIREKAKLADNFKIYEMNDPFIENFTKTETGYVAKLKTSYVSGPKITESDVVEIIKGKGVGTARQDLEKAYDGISRINIQTNYPWVSSVPNDNNRIMVNIEVDSK